MKECRPRMRYFAVLAAALAACASEPPPTSELLRRAQGSVVLVTMDTTRPDHLGPYGSKTVQTPTLSALAKRGLVFEEAYAVAPITLVAHTSILSGQYPTRHGVRNNGIHRVAEGTPSLAVELTRAGYATGAFVSAAVLERRYGLDRGFEVYDDDLSSGKSRAPRMVPDRPAGAVVDSAIRWLESVPKDKPYFLWVHFYDPHASYAPPPPFRDVYRDRLYDGEIAYMDHELGRLLAHPRIKEEAPWIAVTADHGEALGEHGENTHGLLVHDATLKIPFILAGPGIKRATRSRFLVSQVDIAPTLLDLLGRELPQALDGMSLVEKVSAPRTLYSESYLPFYTYGWSKLHAVRRLGFKYIDAPTPLLFNTREDPRELTSVAALRTNEAHDLSRDLAEMTAEKEARLEIDTKALEALRALGYVQTGSTDPYKSGTRPDPYVFIQQHALLERARHHMRDGLNTHAERALREVLASDVNNIGALVDLANVLADQGKLDEAVTTLQRVLELDPGYARGVLTLAQLEARRGNPHKTRELCERAIELDPTFSEAQVVRAHALARTEPKEVARYAAEVLARFPREPNVLVMHAELVDLPGRNLEGARTRLSEALARDPFYAPASILLGDVDLLLGKAKDAEEVYRQGLLRNPDHPGLHAQLGLLLAHGEARAEAEMHLREAIRLAPKMRSDLYTALGALLAEGGRITEAQRYYDQVLQETPKHPGARNNRALALLADGKVREAKEELLALVREFPKHADAYNNLSGIAVSERAWADAERYAKKALELLPASAEAWTNLGVALDELGRTREAKNALEAALTIVPSYWQAAQNLGLVLLKLGEPALAAKRFTDVVAIAPEVPDPYLELGLAYAGPLKDPDAAQKHLLAFLRRAPKGDPDIPRARAALDALTQTPRP